MSSATILRWSVTDDSTPGSGLPQNQQQRLAGTQSGFVTIVRVAAANDRIFPANSRLVQYEGTYKFNAVPNTPLQKGQVTARGVFLVDRKDNLLERPIRYAIVGGTGPFNSAHGKITEAGPGTPTAAERLLDIEV